MDPCLIPVGAANVTTWSQIVYYVSLTLKCTFFANQNYNEVPSHAGQNGCYQKVYKQQMLERMQRREPSYTVGGNAN